MDQMRLLAAREEALRSGDQEAARELRALLMEQPMAPRDLTPREAQERLGEIPRSGAELATEGMSGTDKFLAGLGRSPVAMGQGAKQFAKNVTGAEDADDYSQYVQQEAAQFDQGLGKTGAGMGGKLVGDIGTAAIPGAAVGRGVQAATKLQGAKGMLAGNTAVGALEGAVQPVVSDGDYATTKMNQIGGGAVWSMAPVAALETLRRGIPAAANVQNRAYNYITRKANDNPLGRGNVGREADALGVDLPMGARGGSKMGVFFENMARQSAYSMDTALDADMRVARQATRSIEGLMIKLSLGGKNKWDIGRQVQETVGRATNRLSSSRDQLSQPYWRAVAWKSCP